MSMKKPEVTSHERIRTRKRQTRALLLAGIRSAFLWRQLGGRRWRLLFQRRRLLQTSQQLSRDSSLV